jgi:hypothetical protein
MLGELLLRLAGEPAVPSQPDPFKDGVGKRKWTDGPAPPIS